MLARVKHHRRFAALVTAAILTVPLVVEDAAATTGDNASTTVSEVAAQRFGDGDPAGLGYKVRHAVTAAMAAGERFPTARIDAAEHPEAFEGQWADAGFHAAWISPKREFQYTPDPFTVESGYFDNWITQDGAPLAPGDSAEIAVKQLPADAPLTWDVQRGDATGSLDWDVAVQSQTVNASYGDASQSMDVVFARADLVARGGDFDGRQGSIDLPPLVIELPKSYGPEIRGSAYVAQFAPQLHYIRNVEGQVLPQTGRAVISARGRGYIPEAREHTLVDGTRIREWHIPLNILITLTSTTGILSGQTATELPTGGVVWPLDGGAPRRLEVPPGAQVVTSDGLSPQVRSDDAGAEGEPDGPAAALVGSSGTLMDDIAATGAIDHTIAAPTTVEIAKRSYGLTIDPDLHGRGILGLRSVRELRTAQGFFDTVALPYVKLNGETITLDRSRLVELRLFPLLDYIRIGFTSRNDGSALDPASYGAARHGRIHRAGLTLEAVYDLGNDRYAFLTSIALQQAGGTADSVDNYLEVRSLSQSPAQVSAVHYMEPSLPGPVTYDEQVMTSEFSAPSKTLSLPGTRIFNGATGGGQLTVVAAGAPLSTEPAADAATSIEGVPIGIYVTSRTGSSTGGYFSVLASLLEDVTSRVSVEPGPIEQPCTEPEVVDDAVRDAAGDLDITRSWFDFDGANLLATIEVAQLDETVLGSPIRLRTSWRFEHVGFGLEAARDLTGAWSSRIGLHSSAGSPWGPINSVPVETELSAGTPGYIRMSAPVGVELSGTGFLDGEMLRDTGATSFDANGVRDRAPEGATDVAFGSGGDYRVQLCPARVLETTLEVAAASDTTGQFTDTGSLAARLSDASGAPVVGQTVSFELGTKAAIGITDDAGVAWVQIDLDHAPGTYPLQLSFGGSDGYSASSTIADFLVTREDSALSLTITGVGVKRELRAHLSDADAIGHGISGRIVEFFADGDSIGTATTDQNGIATLKAPPGTRGANVTFSASFAGDSHFVASKAE